MKRISILTLTYNHAKYIAQCIESVLSQDYSNWEHIIIDDGSTDGTGEIIKQYKDPRIRYLYQNHRGINSITETYQRAFFESQGDLLAILEGDDFWPIDKLSTMEPIFNDPKIVLAYGKAKVVQSNGEPMNEFIPSDQFLHEYSKEILFNSSPGLAVKAMLRWGVFSQPCTVVLRRSSLEKINGFQMVSDHHAVDYATFLTLSLQGTFFYVDKIMGFWRRHNSQMNTSPELLSYLEADHKYGIEFLEQHSTLLGISDSEKCEIARNLENHFYKAKFNHGRIMLCRGSLNNAKDIFLQTLKTKNLKVKLMSFFGILSCRTQWNVLEFIFKIFGKPTIRKILGFR